MLAPDTRLGPYVIQAPLGAGGMGDVYLARDTRLDRSVVIKVAKDAFSQRFERAGCVSRAVERFRPGAYAQLENDLAIAGPGPNAIGDYMAVPSVFWVDMHSQLLPRMAPIGLAQRQGNGRPRVPLNARVESVLI